ncbi:MAG TPA: metalloprotease [Thermoplasmata archaeon]|jgi:Zn-dependent protease|nr:metalloprotease [Thermoplasmata archaeon]
MSSWSKPPGGGYWVGAAPLPSRKVTTSPTEVLHILIAFVVLTVDIAIVETGLLGEAAFGGFDPGAVAAGLGFGAAAALTGFLAHELAHKISAERRGFWAEFRMSPVGLLFSLVTAVFGFLFAAPGATVIGGMGSAPDWGKTSLAGPALNLVEGTAFAAAGLALNEFPGHLSAVTFLVLLAFINGWFAAFNMLPFGPLDGRKVLRWSTPVWASTFAVSVAFAGVLFLIVSFGWPVALVGA